MPYVEFVGPPGSGKTTAARALLAAEQELAAGRRTLVNFGGGLRVSHLGLPSGLSNFVRLLLGVPRDLMLVICFGSELSAPLR